MLSTAAEWRLLASVPPFKWMKPPPPEFDFLTFDEAHRLIAGADTEWRTVVAVALRTGLRLGELLALRWSDVGAPHRAPRGVPWRRRHAKERANPEPHSDDRPNAERFATDADSVGRAGCARLLIVRETPHTLPASSN